MAANTTGVEQELVAARDFKAWLALASPWYRVSAIAMIDDRSAGRCYPAIVIERRCDGSTVGVYDCLAAAICAIGVDRADAAWDTETILEMYSQAH